MPFLHILVIVNRLYVNGVKPFSVDVVIFIFGWSLNLDVRAVHTANHPREPSFVIKASLRLNNLCSRRCPLDEVYLFLCKGIGDSRPKRYRLLSSLSVKSVKEKSSRSLNCLSFLFGTDIKPKSPNSKSAILFCLGDFSLD